MGQSTQELLAATKAAAAREFGDARNKLGHCLDQLSEEQLWWRPAPSMNSIANLILHLCGNIHQWITAGVGGAADTRDRPAEFSEQSPIPKSELQQRLDQTVDEAKRVILDASIDDLARVRRVQGYAVTGIEAVFDSVAHFRGHVQEIVHLTRLQLGDSYKFDFVPTTPEQGAPTGN